jgi:hypothetical protein
MKEFREKLEGLCDGISPKWDKDDIVFYLVTTISNLDPMEMFEIVKIAKEKGFKGEN